MRAGSRYFPWGQRMLSPPRCVYVGEGWGPKEQVPVSACVLCAWWEVLCENVQDRRDTAGLGCRGGPEQRAQLAGTDGTGHWGD